jgi:hypothetical protein
MRVAALASLIPNRDVRGRANPPGRPKTAGPATPW